MSQSWARHFYKSPMWDRTRKSYMQTLVDLSGHVVSFDNVDGSGTYCYTEDGRRLSVPGRNVVPPGMCERCFALGRMTPAKVVHHIHHLTPQNIDDPSYSVSFGNLQRLCQDCHAEAHSGKGASRVEFDEDGDPIGPDGSVDQFMVQAMRLTDPARNDRNIYKEANC